MAFAEGMSAGDESDGFFVVHCHTGECFAHVVRGGDGIGVSVWTFGIDVDQPHLDGGEGVFEFAVAAIAFVSEPLGFGSPVDVLLRFPDVLAAAGEADGIESHGFEGDVSG